MRNQWWIESIPTVRQRCQMTESIAICNVAKWTIQISQRRKSIEIETIINIEYFKIKLEN